MEEFLHLLNQGVYVSEQNARKILVRLISKQAEHFEYKKVQDYLRHVEFLDMQEEYKSQHTLLEILNEEMGTEWGMGLKDCGAKSKKYAIYLDDILATGGTIYNDSVEWLKNKDSTGVSNLDKVVGKEKVFLIALLCKHTWGAYNLKWRLSKQLNNDQIRDKIKFQANYVIENHPTNLDQRFNNVYPIRKGQPEEVIYYFNNLNAKYHGSLAFRDEKRPKEENFFSSPENRIRFENILLNKGIELLSKGRKFKDNHRPLGMTNPTKKILGTGTLFFTWRNISNTTPIVFWWEVSNDWYPLFDLDNRGMF